MAGASWAPVAGHRPLDVAGYALLVLSALVLYAGRAHYAIPMPVALAATGGYLALDYPRGPVAAGYLIALFLTVHTGHKRLAWPLAVLGSALYVYLEGKWLAGILIPIGVILAGELFRAQRLRFIEIAKTRAEEHKRQSSDERLRIARELHDVIAHNISLINVQAGVALHLLDGNPEQAREALTVIKAASKETLQELRSTLGMLRRVDEEAPRAPAPGLARLEELLGRLAVSGLDVRLAVTGEPRDLPDSVDLAAFRIAQEALTNVYRHAEVSTARLNVGYEPGAVTVEVLDDGAGGLASEGNGLTGMRERAEALGGTLVAGPRAEGGFRVYARLPS